MKLSELQDTYPSGEIRTTPAAHSGFLNVPIEKKWFILPLEKINSREKKLLQALFPKAIESDAQIIDPIQHPWYSYLFDQTSYPGNTEKTYRAVHFYQQSKLLAVEQINWLESLLEAVPAGVDAFFVNERYGLLIEEKAGNRYTHEEWAGLFLALDGDFGCSTKAYIGSYGEAANIQPLITAEKEIFLSDAQLRGPQQITSFSRAALRYFIKPDTGQHSLIRQLYQQIYRAELETAIIALWQHQGNISVAANTLFIHRNTLQYRLDKFAEQTGLCLRQADDLFICYLALDTVHSSKK